MTPGETWALALEVAEAMAFDWWSREELARVWGPVGSASALVALRRYGLVERVKRGPDWWSWRRCGDVIDWGAVSARYWADELGIGFF